MVDHGLSEEMKSEPDVTVRSERWSAQHRWKRASSFVYDSLPPQYDWVCQRCGLTVLASEPPRDECEGLVE